MKNPPFSNTGGNLPTGDERLTAVNVDWVSVSFPRKALESTIGEFLKQLRWLFDGTVTGFAEGHGLNGYAYSCKSDVGSVHVAWGGNNDTVFLKISGDGCARIVCFATLADFIRQRCGHLTRLDIAFDDFAGQWPVDKAVDLYRSGMFRSNLGGARSGASRASCCQIGNWLAPDGGGRTFNVGKLKNGKMLCVYEKGRQLGDPTSEWVRWEVRFANRDRAIPLEALVDPAPYARGAYLALDFIAGESCRIGTRRTQERISLGKLTHHARESYGPLFDVLRRSGLEALEVVTKLTRSGTPKRLGAPTESDLIDRFHFLIAAAVGEELDGAKIDMERAGKALDALWASAETNPLGGNGV